MWLFQASQFHIVSERNGSGNAHNNYDVEVGKVYEIELIQGLQDGKMMFEIIVNGDTFVKEENAQPTTIQNAKVYLGDPWWSVADVDLDYFLLTTK